MNSSFVTESLSYTKDGQPVTVTIRHPPIRPLRQASIHYFIANGCSIVPDPLEMPGWLHGLDRECGVHIVNHHMELLPIYKVAIPDTATIQGSHLERLNEIPELKHLCIYFPVRPENLAALHLRELEVLILVGESFCDEHVLSLPDMGNIKMIDLQTTVVTEKGTHYLRNKYPSAEIYHATDWKGRPF